MNMNMLFVIAYYSTCNSLLYVYNNEEVNLNSGRRFASEHIQMLVFDDGPVQRISTHQL